MTKWCEDYYAIKCIDGTVKKIWIFKKSWKKRKWVQQERKISENISARKKKVFQLFLRILEENSVEAETS